MELRSIGSVHEPMKSADNRSEAGKGFDEGFRGIKLDPDPIRLQNPIKPIANLLFLLADLFHHVQIEDCREKLQNFLWVTLVDLFRARYLLIGVVVF